MSGLREELIGVTMFPAALNTGSDGVLVAQMHFKQPWPGILPHYSTTKRAGLRWPPLTNSNWKQLLRYEVLTHLTLNAPHHNSLSTLDATKRPLKIIWTLCQHIINKTRHQFTVGNLHYITFNHLADAFIQSDVQMRRTIEAIRPSREQQYTSAMTSLS